MAIAQTVFGQEGQAIYSANYVLGRTIGENSPELTALALTTELEITYEFLVGQTGTKCGMLAGMRNSRVYRLRAVV